MISGIINSKKVGYLVIEIIIFLVVYKYTLLYMAPYMTEYTISPKGQKSKKAFDYELKNYNIDSIKIYDGNERVKNSEVLMRAFLALDVGKSIVSEPIKTTLYKKYKHLRTYDGGDCGGCSTGCSSCSSCSSCGGCGGCGGSD